MFSSASLASASGIVPPDHPATNYTPTSAAERCADVSSSKLPCSALLLAEIDKARAAEGVGPMTLPTSFGSFSAAEQLLTLANLERVDRGLGAVAGLSPQLDVEAQEGAAASNDPNGPQGFAWGSNWSGASSTLYNDLGWMYDDGPGSYNLACTYPGAAGCWGHRDNVLRAWEEPIGIGAGAQDSSQTQLFVSAYTPATPGGADEAIAPLWPSILQTLPVGVAPSSVVLTDSATTTQVMVWASGEPMDVRDAVATGWSVTPGECDLPAGSSCELALVAPDGSTPSATILTLDGPNGTQSVDVARHIAVHVAAHLARNSVSRRQSDAVTGEVTPVPAGQRISVQIRHGGTWRRVGEATPNSAGQFTVRLKSSIAGTRRYRLAVSAEDGYEAANSSILVLRVT